MQERKPNCIGHAFFIARIDNQEKYRKPPALEELGIWFDLTRTVSSAVIIAIVRGDIQNQNKHDEVEHMIARVGASDLFSHRPAEGANVENGPANILLAEYRNALGVYYTKFLVVK